MEITEIMIVEKIDKIKSPLRLELLTDGRGLGKCSTCILSQE